MDWYDELPTMDQLDQLHVMVALVNGSNPRLRQVDWSFWRDQRHIVSFRPKPGSDRHIEMKLLDTDWFSPHRIGKENFIRLLWDIGTL